MQQVLSPSSLKMALVYFICDANLPLSITNSPAFQALLELCNPAVTNILVCQASLTPHLTNIYFYHQESICNYLLSNKLDVFFTTDAWTSPNITSYMAITAHYIDTDFKLTSIIIGLSKIEGDHSGASLAIIHRYDLEQKIICITTDNTSVNNKMAQEIEETCPRFFAKDNMVGCMAHTIHLAEHNGLKALGIKHPNTNNQVDNNNENPISISSLVDPPDGLNLQYNSIIGKIILLASYLCHSPQRHKKFITTVNLVYNSKKPTNAIKLDSQVSTRWNSTYKMLNFPLVLNDAYNHFCTPDSLASFQLSTLEWQKAKVMVHFLQPLYEETLLICGSSYTKINQLLPLYTLLIEDIGQEQHEIVVERSTCLLDKIHPSASLEGSSLELELKRYLAKPPEPKDTNILLFWKSQVIFISISQGSKLPDKKEAQTQKSEPDAEHRGPGKPSIYSSRYHHRNPHEIPERPPLCPPPICK
ncbi:hypothetical protein O181_058539 [Austropuccinia psidii MF-1]|uniref:Uncharacterized protein n=1 Tax=Austropuccinia psidii MF-1 TaxID=1389203 RepID=A0A9Q3ECM4_9BASI|nr:hypothetical protein [Austropuccinia psidii MF-1]